MPINANHVQFFKAQVNDDTPNNGGTISNSIIMNGVKNNIFPDASKLERQDGSIRFRKVFMQLRNPDDTQAIDLKLFIMRPTQANDAVLIVDSDLSYIQDDIGEEDRRWGAGQLLTSANLGDTVITVTPEQSIYQVFHQDDTIAITTRSDVEPNAPIDFYKIIAVVNSGSNKVLTLNRGLATAMPVGAVVSSCLFKDILVSKLVGYISQSSSGPGAFNINDVVVNNAGSVDGDFKLVFTSSTNFDLYYPSTDLVVIASGNIASDFSPLNPDNNNPYFTVPSSAFVGPFSANDWFEFSLEAPYIPFFLHVGTRLII